MVIVGTPKDANGGWLLLSGKEFQDTQIYVGSSIDTAFNNAYDAPTYGST